MNDKEITLIDALLYAMDGKDLSRAIENKERRGQQDVVRNQRLPRRMNNLSVSRDILWDGITNDMDFETYYSIQIANVERYTKQHYEKIGIRILDEYDDLFWNVELPEGWSIKATDHSMWNNLYDDKGRKRAIFFYKAAFYDRDAFINFETRFKVSIDHVSDPSEDYDIWSKSDYQGTIKDGDTVIFETASVHPTGDYFKDYILKNNLRNVLEKWMESHYPNWKDINAYWD